MDLNVFTFKLANGAHQSAAQGTCFMEAVAWMAREPHSDKPKCACPVLGAYGIRLNDRMTDGERKALNPLILKMMNTRSPAYEETRLAHLIQAGATRILAPIFEVRGWNEEAAMLRSLPVGATRREMLPTLNRVKESTRKKAAAYAYAAYAYAAYAAAYAYAAYAYAAYAYAAANRHNLHNLWATESVKILDEAIQLGPHNSAELYDAPALTQRIKEFRETVSA